MSLKVYFSFRLIIASMLLVIGGCLYWGIIPKKLQGSIFDSSRKCIAIAIMVMPLSTFLVYFLSLRFEQCSLHIMSYLTACYVISIFVTVGFVPLLGGKFDFRQWRFIRGLISIPFFAMPMTIANLNGNPELMEIAKIITTVLLVITITYQSYIFIKFYKEAVQRSNNYYSDDVEVDINWIIKSVIAVFTMEMVCAISTFFGRMGLYAELLLTLYRVGTLVYVFSQFIKFMKNFETMISVSESPEIEQEVRATQLSDEQHKRISTELEKWIAVKGFTKSGVTIDDAAMEVATNRTYLSLYINTTFNCSFKVWITSLRIELAKELLMKNSTTINISQSVGFASPQSFMHAFKRAEGCTATEWRNKQKSLNNEPPI